MFSLGQLCHNTLAANPQAPFIIRQIAENCVMNDQLGTIVQYFERVFDIEESEENSRFVVKHGVDSSLDHKKKVHNGLPNLLFQLAQEEVMQHRAKAFLKLYLQFCTRSKAKLFKRSYVLHHQFYLPVDIQVQNGHGASAG
jgi:hypothetical protein